MAHDLTLRAGTHLAVGPYPAYDHGGLTLMNSHDDGDIVTTAAVCLDCGYLAGDIRQFAHIECDRAANPIQLTWRERVYDEGLDAFGVGEPGPAPGEEEP